MVRVFTSPSSFLSSIQRRVCSAIERTVFVHNRRETATRHAPQALMSRGQSSFVSTVCQCLAHLPSVVKWVGRNPSKFIYLRNASADVLTAKTFIKQLETLQVPEASLRRSLTSKRLSGQLEKCMTSSEQRVSMRLSGVLRGEPGLMLDERHASRDPLDFFQFIVSSLREMPRFQVEYAEDEPRDPFAPVVEGATNFTVHCPCCRTVNAVTQSWTGLVLDASSGGDLVQSVQETLHQEKNTGPKAFKCRACGNETLPNQIDAERVYPPVLQLLLQSAPGDRKSACKATARVSVPRTINPGDFCPPPPEDDFSDEASSSSLLVQPEGPPDYNLYAVIARTGQSHEAHYVAYVRTKEGRWFMCDDSTVKTISPRTLSQSVLSGFGSKAPRPYMLFYCSEHH